MSCNAGEKSVSFLQEGGWEGADVVSEEDSCRGTSESVSVAE